MMLRQCPFSRSTAGTLLFCFSVAIGTAGEPSRTVRLTTDGSLKSGLVFVNKGKELVYVRQQSPVQMRIMRLKLTDRSTKPLHPEASRTEFDPAFSADGRYQVFLQNRGNLSVALVIRDTVAHTDAVIKPAGGFSAMRSPAISPDNRRVLYSYPVGGRQSLFSVNMQAADRKQLTNTPGINNWPNFSPDGKQIVLGSTRDGNFELYIMKADGSLVRRLTNHPRLDIRPRFSPDGKRIAFVSNRDGNYEVYTMKTDGSDLQRITRNLERDDYPVWHPDGRKLAIVSERAGRYDIYLIPAGN